MISLRKFRNKRECSLSLDIGTEAVKAVVFEKAGREYRILSSALEYFNELRPFDNDEVILKVKEEAAGGAGKRPDGLLVGLPPSVLRSRLKAFTFNRENHEKIITKDESKTIIESALKGVEKEIAGEFAEDFGILPQDIRFVGNKILEIKIDGYEVPGILGYKGRNLELKILASFLPKAYLKNFGGAQIISQVKSLYHLGIPNGVFLDIGGDVTQVCLIRNNSIEFIDEFSIGGNNFSRAIQQKLGMSHYEARLFKERYSRGELTHDAMERTKEILSPPLRDWHSALESKLKTASGLLPSNFFIFGGGSQLPDIKEMIAQGDREIKFVCPKDFKDTIYNAEISSNPQFTILILILHGKENFRH